MFLYNRVLWVDYLPVKHGISFGVHWDWFGGRIDFHLGPWIISLGRVPVYNFSGTLLAVSSSYHARRVEKDSLAQPATEYERPRR